MCVVGPNGIVAHAPRLKGEAYEACNRKGRTLSLYGPAPNQDGTNCGGYILLPHKTNRTDVEIAAWTEGWVKEHPIYGLEQCQTYSVALYKFLVNREFPYHNGKPLGALFSDAVKRPHYQATFQWTCRQKN